MSRACAASRSQINGGQRKPVRKKRLQKPTAGSGQTKQAGFEGPAQSRMSEVWKGRAAGFDEQNAVPHNPIERGYRSKVKDKPTGA